MMSLSRGSHGVSIVLTDKHSRKIPQLGHVEGLVHLEYVEIEGGQEEAVLSVYTWPWFAAPSPYKLKLTPPSPLYLWAKAIPAPKGT